MTKSRSRLTSFGFMLTEDGKVDEQLYSQLEQQAAELESLHHDAVARAKKIDGDDAYTSRGRERRKRALMTEITKDLERFYRQATKPMMHMGGPSLQLELDQLKAELERPQGDKEDPTLTFLRYREIRDLLRAQEPTQREATVRAQAARGDYTYLSAVLAAPEGSEAFILPVTRDSLVQERINNTSPQTAARIEVLELAQSRLLGMLGSFKAALKKAGIEEEQPDTVALLAGSG